MRAFLLAILIALTPAAEGARRQEEAVRIGLPEPVELAMVVAAISPLDRDGATLDREGAYFESVEAHFGAYRDHPLFDALGAEFNLPRLAGNAADFAFGESGELIETDSSGSLWGDREGDLFRNNLELLEHFARESGFRDFYAASRAVYAAGAQAMASQIDTAAMTTWLHDNFSERPGAIEVIVSPLIGGLNWTTLNEPQTRIWLGPPSGEAAEALGDYERVLASVQIFTELDHSYVNPVTARHLGNVQASFGDIAFWADERGAGAYPSAELQFNEYMTWAVFLMYAADQLGPADYERLEALVVSYMVDNRGFIRFQPFARRALSLYRSGMDGEAVVIAMADRPGVAP